MTIIIMALRIVSTMIVIVIVIVIENFIILFIHKKTWN